MTETLLTVGGFLLSLLLTGLGVKHPRVAAALRKSLPPGEDPSGTGTRDYPEISNLISAETGAVAWELHGPQLVLGIKGTILAANDAARQILGKTLAELREFSYRDLLHSDVEGHLSSWIELTTGEAKSYRRPERLVGRDGVLSVEVTAARVPNATHGEKPVAHILLRDKNELETLKERVAQLEERLKGDLPQAARLR